MDKGGNFIGWLWIDETNLSIALVEAGLSTVHVTAESSRFSHQLQQAEESAIQKKLCLYKNYVKEDKEEPIMETIKERKLDYESVVISEVTNEGKLFAQFVSEGKSLEDLMNELRLEFIERPPVGGAFVPRKGQ